MTENPYAIAATSAPKGGQPAIEALLRSLYIAAWIVIFGFRWIQETGVASPDHFKSFYDSVWIATAVAVVVINLYIFLYTRWKLVLVNLSLRLAYQLYTLAFIIGWHASSPSSLFHASTALLWPLIIFRIRSENAVYRWALRVDAVVLLGEYIFQIVMEFAGPPGGSFAFVYILIRLFTSTVHPFLLAAYSFPKNYPWQRRNGSNPAQE